jgi:probable rRNA maturation factor
VSVELRNESGSAVDEAALGAVARFVLSELGVHPQAELSVYLVDEPAMERLHELHLGEPGPTDVLAFGMDELSAGRADDDDEGSPPVLLGDVILCPGVAAAQARQAGHSAAEELALLCTHGVLHLLGYDHGEPDEERQMFALQSDLLARWRAAKGRR